MLKPSEQQELERIQESLAAYQEGHEERTTRRIAQALLLGRNYYWNGALCTPVAKHVGAGIYAVTVKKNRA